MSGTTQRKTVHTTNSYSYILKILLASAVIISVNALIIAFQLDQEIASANLLLISSLVLIFYALGDFLDKRLILWSFRFYRWAMNQGLFESVDTDAQ